MFRRSLAALLTLALVAGTASQVVAAEDVSKKVRNACTTDVKRLCPNNKFGSEGLRYCMEANGKRLSRTCVQALEDDGVIPRGYLKG